MVPSRRLYFSQFSLSAAAIIGAPQKITPMIDSSRSKSAFNLPFFAERRGIGSHRVGRDRRYENETTFKAEPQMSSFTLS